MLPSSGSGINGFVAALDYDDPLGGDAAPAEPSFCQRGDPTLEHPQIQIVTIGDSTMDNTKVPGEPGWGNQLNRASRGEHERLGQAQTLATYSFDDPSHFTPDGATRMAELTVRLACIESEELCAQFTPLDCVGSPARPRDYRESGGKAASSAKRGLLGSKSAISE